MKRPRNPARALRIVTAPNQPEFVTAIQKARPVAIALIAAGLDNPAGVNTNTILGAYGLELPEAEAEFSRAHDIAAAHLIVGIAIGQIVRFDLPDTSGPSGAAEGPENPLGKRWIEHARHVAFADRFAHRIVLQAPFPTASELVDFDDALTAIAKRLPDHHVVTAKITALYAALERESPAGEIWNELHGELMAHCQDAGFIFGLALGSRLGREALQLPEPTGGLR